MGRRIKGAFHFTWESAPFDVEEMKATYQTCTGLELGEETPNFIHRLFAGYDNTPLVMRTFKHFGIGYLGAHYDRGASSVVPRLYIDRFFRVDEKDVFLVTRLLASGYPLVTSFLLGQLFTLTNKGQVYLPPTPYGELGGHAIVLTGSGKAPNPCRGGVVETCYACRNGHGPVAHSDYHKQNFGDDFLIFASDVRFIWGFTLRPESAQYASGPWPPMSLPQQLRSVMPSKS